MIWECAAGLQFEASGINDPVRGSGQIMMFYRKSTVQPLITEALEKLSKTSSKSESELEEATGNLTLESSPAGDTLTESATSGTSDKRLIAWHQFVNELSGRRLAKPSDKLLAIAGLAAIIDNRTIGDYLAGIWSKDIAAGLSWGRTYSLLTAAPTYRAPSWSWASVDGKISCYLLDWSTTLMEEHAREPAWIERYGVKLVEHHMKLRIPSKPYAGVLEGSYLVVEGACVTTTQFLELAKNDKFGVTAILDKANTFDCPCCGPKSPEEIANTSDKPKEPHLPFDMVLILQGNAWREQESFCDMLLLKWVNQEENTLERVGFARLRSEWPAYGQTYDAVATNEQFDAGGWVREVMKLV
jgi:hypothetical protein